MSEFRIQMQIGHTTINVKRHRTLLYEDEARRLLGITEVDVRDITPLPNFDVYRLRTCNHRTFYITGREVVMGHLIDEDQAIDWGSMMRRQRRDYRRTVRRVRKWLRQIGK